MVEWLREIFHLLAPEICHLCKSDSSDSNRYKPFCDDCVRKMKSGSRQPCARCGSEIGEAVNSAYKCQACRNEQFSFSRVWRFGLYQGLIKETVLKCKLPKGEFLAEAAGWLIAQDLKSDSKLNHPDAIVPVPSHWTKSLIRGHNPALGIALGLAKAIRAPCRSEWLRKIRSTPSQTSLPPDKRRTVPCNAFGASIPMRNRSGIIWLVDDVLTTGTTASACAKALLKQGAGEVIAIVLARGGQPQQELQQAINFE